MKTNTFFLLALLATATALNGQSARLQTVQANYQRFGQGDIPGILATLSDNATWTHPGNHAVVPFAGTFTGREAIGRDFFQVVNAAVLITLFQPGNFREQGNQVINDVHIEGKALNTGQPYATDVVFYWTFNDAGQVTSWEAKGDVSTLEQALTAK
jgi:ketosteroid isomerase-like protein